VYDAPAMTWDRDERTSRTWKDLSGLQLVVWPIVIVFMLQVLLAGGLEKPGSGGGLMNLLGIDVLSVWAAGAQGAKGLLQNGEWWRLICPIFLHFSVIHVGMNMMAAVSLGRLVEMIFGRSGFILIFISTGIAGTLLSLAWTMLSPEQPRLGAGASGAVCGLLGVLLAHMRGRSDAPARMFAASLMRWTIFLAIWSLLPGISLTDHLGGFVMGYVLGKVMAPAHFRSLAPARRRLAVPLAAAALYLLCLAALIVSGLGARERLEDVRAVIAFTESLEEADRMARRADKDLASVEGAIALQDVPPELKPLKQKVLRAIKAAGPTFMLLPVIVDAHGQAMAWLAEHAPDLFGGPAP